MLFKSKRIDHMGIEFSGVRSLLHGAKKSRVLGKCILLAVGLICIGGCQAEGNRAHTIMGVDIGKNEWNEISDADSVMRVIESPKVRKIENSASAMQRYRERIYLYPGIISYERLYVSLDTTWGTKESMYQLFSDHPMDKRYGLDISRDDIKTTRINGIDYAFIAKKGSSGLCFFFFAFFGNMDSFTSQGDRDVRGGVCHRFGRVTLSNLEGQWLDLLSRLRFDGPKPGWASSPSEPQSDLKPIDTAPARRVTARTGTGRNSDVDQRGTEVRPVAVWWQGLNKLLAGTVSVRPDTKGGKMFVTLPQDKGTCTGAYIYGSKEGGTWSIACANNLAASGTFVAFGNGKGAAGTGIDNQGRQVEFTMGGRN